MLRKKLTASLMLIGCLTATASNCFATETRLTLRGLSGTHTYADGDLLFGLKQTANSLLYIDGQGRYDDHDNGFGALGLGYRTIRNNKLYGINLFTDYAKTNLHNYLFVSPGVESMWSYFDARINGYLPINQRHELSHFFPSGLVDCGIPTNDQFIEFRGHQQFEHRFLCFEEVGPGIDAAIGFYLPHSHGANFHGGAYYYHLKDHDDVKGLGVRVELPINAMWAVTSEASYDNVEHGAITFGLRFQIGHLYQHDCNNLGNRLYEPVYRHIGPVGIGTGVPTVIGYKDEGLFLTRDNIYFYSQTGTATLGLPNAGTFENPFANNQFTNAATTLLGTNSNFYFNSGNFDLGEVVTLVGNQAVFGRENNFRSSAIGDARPTLFGSLIIHNGTHRLDSIILEDQYIGPLPSQLTALNIQNANVNICNCIIDATTKVTVINNGNNFATGIYANNSNIQIERSTISANAILNSHNNGNNFAAGIGANNVAETTNVANNNFTILDSTVSGIAQVAGDNLLILVTTVQNSAAGIGSNTSLGNIDFTNNNFNIFNSYVTGKAVVEGDNNNFNFASGIGSNTFSGFIDFIDNNFEINCSSVNGVAQVNGNNTNFINTATGIGNNARSEDDIIPSPPGTITANFQNNSFNITNSNIDGAASVKANNSALNFSTGIGSNANATAVFESTVVIANFIQNAFNILSSQINSQTFSTINSFSNSAVALGGNTRARSFGFTPAGFADVTANFINNKINIAASELKAKSEAVINTSLNFSTGIGGNTSANANTNIGNRAVVNFIGNKITIAETIIDADALVASNDLGDNCSTGIGGNSFLTANSIVSTSFIDNVLTLSDSQLISNSIVMVNNVSGNNMSTGIGGNFRTNVQTEFSNNNINVSCTNFEINSIVIGNNVLGQNTSTGIRLDFDSHMNLFASVLNVSSIIKNQNTGDNKVLGLFVDSGSILNIENSVINLFAIANGSNQVIVQDGAGDINISNTSC